MTLLSKNSTPTYFQLQKERIGNKLKPNIYNILRRKQVKKVGTLNTFPAPEQVSFTTGKMKGDVLVTDGHWRKSLAAVRGLGKRGIRVTVGESTRLATAAFSKYCRRAVVYPSPTLKPQDFLDFLSMELRRHSYQMLLPMEYETLALVASHREQFSRWTYLPFGPSEKLHFAQSKDKVLDLAERLGVPVPKTWHINDLSQLEAIKDRLPYPVVVKPRTGSGALGISYPGDGETLVRDYRSIHQVFPFPLIQEFIPSNGPGYGASFLFDEKGQVKASFVHRRLREYPITGGASTLRESVRKDDVRDLALTLLKALDWFGVAMVEFKLDPRDGVPKLMEINPRFWGSLSLAVDAGVNFPYLMYRMSLGEEFDSVEDYPLGRRCRWLLPGDILHFIRNPGRGSLLPEFLRFWDKRTSYDICSRDDPLPMLATVLTLLTLVYDPDMRMRMKKRRRCL